MIIEARGTGYKGSITRTFTINPTQAAIKRAAAGKRKMTVTAKTKVGKTTYCGAWSKVKTTKKIK